MTSPFAHGFPAWGLYANRKGFSGSEKPFLFAPFSEMVTKQGVSSPLVHLIALRSGFLLPGFSVSAAHKNSLQAAALPAHQTDVRPCYPAALPKFHATSP